MGKQVKLYLAPISLHQLETSSYIQSALWFCYKALDFNFCSVLLAKSRDQNKAEHPERG